jgi:hypothetical protein
VTRTVGSASFSAFLAHRGWPGAVDLPSAECIAWRDAWRSRYGKLLHERFGEWAHGGYEWHAFSYPTVPSADGDVALAEYGARSGPVVVITADVADPLAGARFAEPPRATIFAVERKREPPDLLVFPESLAWTFAVTHEWGTCGPYFAPFAKPSPAPPARRERNRSP